MKILSAFVILAASLQPYIVWAELADPIHGHRIQCACPAVYSPVCGSDGKTYSNRCVLDCEIKRRELRCEPPLKFLHDGECRCVCDRRYDPVCASDLKTYNNRCLLKCENKRRAALGLDPLFIVDNKRCNCNCEYCSPVKDEVCGSDLNTYRNRCWLNCYSVCHRRYGLPYLFRIKNGPC